MLYPPHNGISLLVALVDFHGELSVSIVNILQLEPLKPLHWIM